MIVVVIPAVGIAVTSLAAFAGRWVWWLDVLANFRAQYIVGLMVLGSILLASKWRKIAYGVLAVAGVNLAFVAPLYLGSPGVSDPALPGLRVMSFNLLSTNENYVGVIDYIRSANPDLVFLYEASRPWEVAIEAAGLDYEVIRGRSEESIFGTLILARDEVDAVSHGFAADQPRAVELVYTPDKWPVTIDVLSTHPLAPTNEVRAKLRDAQLKFAARWAAGRDGPAFVVGDFNATPWSYPFRNLMTQGGLVSSQVGFGLQATFPVTSNAFLRVPIDHLLVNESITVRDRRLGPSLGSDHFVLIVDLQYVPPS